MKRMSSTIVTIGLLAVLAAACDDTEEKADWSVVCTTDASRGVGQDHLPTPVEKELRRVADHNCPNDQSSGFYHPAWIASGHRAPAVGEKLTAGSYVGTQPGAGTIGRPPASGGFGTTRGSTAG